MSEKEFNNQNTPTEGELMVTITLDEYRELVKDSARMSHYLGETLRLEKELKNLNDKYADLEAVVDERGYDPNVRILPLHRQQSRSDVPEL